MIHLQKREFETRRAKAQRLDSHMRDWAWGVGTTCWWCDRAVVYDTLAGFLSASREHVIPRSAGGGTGAEGRNIVVACAQCNNARSSRMDWKPYHRLSEIGLHVPRHQWDHLALIDRRPSDVVLANGKLAPAPLQEELEARE